MGTPATGIMLPRDLDSGRILEYGRRAEALGFDELWVVEDLGFRGGIAQAGALLAATSRIRIGVGVLPAAARNAAFAAMEIATLGQLFPGRIEVAIGHGMPAWMRSVGEHTPRPLGLLEETLTAVRALLRGERAESAGQVVLDGVALESRAVPEHIPELLAGVRGPRSLAASGRIADGTVLAEPSTPEYVRAAREQIAATGAHRIVAYNIASVHPDPAVAVEHARPGLEWIGEPDWAPHLNPLPFAGELRALRERCATREEFTEAMPGEWVARLALAGTPETVRARLDQLYEAGASSAVLVPIGPDPLAALEPLAAVLKR
ncbi:LLM class flavin-dependent oxidoreductase [Sciscionella sediminilitoris]|uniref:LLM class flavin-dependent oxidoreductase n=1 Tax=Sciscionella sediminilitoris TaxID=1445613 RepID=UPI0004DFA1A0|nr:LLM class flavin-dependent oxidoreductase [Sciscionella sp. SE31]